MRASRALLAALLAGVLAPAGTAEAHLCDNVFRQADKLVVNPEIQNVIVKDSVTFKVFLQNNMDRGIAQIRLAGSNPAFVVTVTPESMTIPKGQKVFFEVDLKVKPGVSSGSYPLAFRLFAVKDGKEQEFKKFDLGATAGKQGPPPPREVAVPRLAAEEKVAIDADPSDAPWKRAAVISGFLSTRDGKAARLHTVVLAIRDGERLYLAATCIEPAGAEDELMVRIAPPGRGAAIREVALRPDGARFRTTAGGKTTEADAPGLQARSARADGHWTAEAAIPWALLGGPPAPPGEDADPAKEEPWLLNLVRERKGEKPETSFWSGQPTTYRWTDHYGRMTFPR